MPVTFEVTPDLKVGNVKLFRDPKQEKARAQVLVASSSETDSKEVFLDDDIERQIDWFYDIDGFGGRVFQLQVSIDVWFAQGDTFGYGRRLGKSTKTG